MSKEKTYLVCKKHGDVTDYNISEDYLKAYSPHEVISIKFGGGHKVNNLCKKCIVEFLEKFKCIVEER